MKSINRYYSSEEKRRQNNSQKHFTRKLGKSQFNNYNLGWGGGVQYPSLPYSYLLPYHSILVASSSSV